MKSGACACLDPCLPGGPVADGRPWWGGGGSGSVPVASGVPRGLVLGPVLFLVCVGGLPDGLSVCGWHGRVPGGWGQGGGVAGCCRVAWADCLCGGRGGGHGVRPLWVPGGAEAASGRLVGVACALRGQVLGVVVGAGCLGVGVLGSPHGLHG